MIKYLHLALRTLKIKFYERSSTLSEGAEASFDFTSSAQDASAPQSKGRQGISNCFVSIVLSFVLMMGLVSCQPNPTSDELIIFAAASLTDSFAELAKAFEEQNPDVSTILNFASSSQLAAQLREGVAADIFASANKHQMEAVIASGRVVGNDVGNFAANQLIMIVPKGNPAGIQDVADLAGENLSLLMAVVGVPVRDYADQMIANLPGDIQKRIYENLISEESNVRQVATKIALGEADAGIVYTSDITPDIADRVEAIPIPDTQNIEVTYPMAVIADSDQVELARRFIDFVTSQTGQAILADWGFKTLSETMEAH